MVKENTAFWYFTSSLPLNRFMKAGKFKCRFWDINKLLSRRNKINNLKRKRFKVRNMTRLECPFASILKEKKSEAMCRNSDSEQ